MTDANEVQRIQVAEPSPAGKAAGIVVGVAIALIVALPLAAVGAGVGWRVFCMIAGAC